MNNIFLNRVGRLLEGLPVKGHSGASKPIRDPVCTQEGRKTVPSEYELHTQVLQNTWGRIEFEIQPALQALTERDESGAAKTNNAPVRKELDCRVRVKTRYRMAMEEQLRNKPTEECPEHFLMPNQESVTVTDKPVVVPINPKERTDRDLSTSEILERKSPARTKHSTCARVEKINLDEKIAKAKTQIRREFYCRESRRMLTLVSERKANAEVLKEKSVS